MKGLASLLLRNFRFLCALITLVSQQYMYQHVVFSAFLILIVMSAFNPKMSIDTGIYWPPSKRQEFINPLNSPIDHRGSTTLVNPGLCHLSRVKTCTVTDFLFIGSICLRFSRVQFKNGPEYLIRETTQVFISLILFVLLKYYFLILFFLLSLFIWWRPLLIFPWTRNFPSLQAFWSLLTIRPSDVL